MTEKKNPKNSALEDLNNKRKKMMASPWLEEKSKINLNNRNLDLLSQEEELSNHNSNNPILNSLKEKDLISPILKLKKELPKVVKENGDNFL